MWNFRQIYHIKDNEKSMTNMRNARNILVGVPEGVSTT
jgi:hypothetical protein